VPAITVMMFSSVRFATKGICVVVIDNIIGHYSSAYLHSNDNALPALIFVWLVCLTAREKYYVHIQRKSKFNNIFSKTIHKRGRVGLLGKRLLTSIGKI
jgi:hypothetical protein